LTLPCYIQEDFLIRLHMRMCKSLGSVVGNNAYSPRYVARTKELQSKLLSKSGHLESLK